MRRKWWPDPIIGRFRAHAPTIENHMKPVIKIITAITTLIGLIAAVINLLPNTTAPNGYTASQGAIQVVGNGNNVDVGGQTTNMTSGDQSPIVTKNSAPVNIDYSTNISGSALINEFPEEQKRKLQQTSIVYRGKWELGKFETPITATVNGQTYEIISEKESGCYVVENQQDFDGNGSTDALVKEITACGNKRGQAQFIRHARLESADTTLSAAAV